MFAAIIYGTSYPEPAIVYSLIVAKLLAIIMIRFTVWTQTFTIELGGARARVPVSAPLHQLHSKCLNPYGKSFLEPPIGSLAPLQSPPFVKVDCWGKGLRVCLEQV
jgi:hypothetical protein